MIELPGHASTGCGNCMSINHQTQQCEEDNEGDDDS